MKTGTCLVFSSVAVVAPGRLLLVQESKPDVRGLWSLPGGRLERGESIVAGAVREAAEETGLHVTPSDLLGVYTGPGWVWFVLRGTTDDESVPVAGDEILAVAWRDLDEIDGLHDEELANAAVLRSVVDRIRRRLGFPLDALA